MGTEFHVAPPKDTACNGPTQRGAITIVCQERNHVEVIFRDTIAMLGIAVTTLGGGLGIVRPVALCPACLTNPPVRQNNPPAPIRNP